ncbi:hypothetical protein LCGC14_3136310, partial [marine sediment metagenome]
MNLGMMTCAGSADVKRVTVSAGRVYRMTSIHLTRTDTIPTGMT